MSTGRTRATGRAVIGSGHVMEDGESLVFYFLRASTGPGLVFEGSLRLPTLVGRSRYFFLNDAPTAPAGNSIVSVFNCP